MYTGGSNGSLSSNNPLNRDGPAVQFSAGGAESPRAGSPRARSESLTAADADVELVEDETDLQFGSGGVATFSNPMRS